MAVRTSNATGDWSAGGTWVGGVAPTSADDAVIASPHVVTIDNTTCVCNSFAINSGGTLQASTTASSKLTVENGGSGGGTFNAILTADVTKTFDLVLNNVGTASDTQWTLAAGTTCNFSGFSRKRKTTLLTAVTTTGGSSLTATVADATGWQVGDKIVFGTTQAYSATPKTDEITIVTVNTGTGVITWTGAPTYAHDIGGHVGNFSSNVTIKPTTAGKCSWLFVKYEYNNSPNAKTFSNVLFSGMYCGNYESYAVLGVSNSGINATTNLRLTVNDNAFYNTYDGAFGLKQVTAPITYNRNIVYSANMGSSAAIQAAPNGAVSTSGSTFNEFGIFRARDGYSGRDSGVTFSNGFISGCSGTGLSAVGTGTTATDVEIYSNLLGISHDNGTIDGTRLNVGTFNNVNGSTTTNSTSDSHVLICKNVLTDSKTQTLALTNITTALANHSLTFVNKNQDVTLQEIYRPYMSVKRDNSNFTRSTSSVAIGPTKVSTNSQRTVQVPCANGSSIRIIGYVKKSHATNISATVAVSGLGSAWGGFTKANDTAWEKYDTGSITNSSGADGNFTLTYTANSSSGTTNVAYFDGVPDSPFVTKARHYGYLFDEANPNRVTNSAISASEATAAAYTNITISGATSVSPWSIGASKTFQQVYDYSQAYACLNLTYAVPLSATGVAGTIALTALANATTTGFTLDGGGSLAMGAFTLTANQPWAYTFTGGAFSQGSGSGLPVFAGGTLQITTTGTKTLQMTGGTLNFTAAGSVDMSASTLASSVILTNTSGGTVNLTLAAGQSYTNTGPNITISSPTLERGIAFTGLQTGTSIQVFTSGTQTKLFGDNSTAGSTFAFDDATGGSITVDYTIQKTGYFPQRVTGVVLTGAVGGQVDVVVSQVVDRAYVASSGLTYGTTAVITVGTNPTTSPGTKTFTLSTASTVQNWYSFWIEQWNDLGNASSEALANVAFPLSQNGPNSFTLGDGWTFSNGATSIAFLSRDGLRYTNTSGVLQKAWAAILTSGVPSGARVRYQQTDGGTTGSAVVTSGNMDELLQVYDIGVYDYRTYLVLKVQEAGYDQAEVDVYATYGALEDQLYVVGLTPLANGVATGDPALTITVADHGASPVTWNGKQYSITITDNATPSTGTNIMRELRYNFEAGGTYQGKDTFNWHDLVQVNGSKFKGVRGKLFGDTGATLKGVRVVTSDGTSIHPDFDLFTADDGTTYAAPIVANVSITGLVNAGAVPTRLQLINTTALSAAAWASGTYALGALRKRTTGIGTESTAGLYMRVTTAGTTGGAEPTWNTTPGGTTTDGSVVWTTYKVLFYDADPASTGYSTTYTNGNEFTTGETVTLRFAEMNAGTTFKRGSGSAITSSTGFSIVATIDTDAVYATNALNGESYEATFSPNFTTNYIVLDANTDFSGKAAYAYFCFTLTSSNGLYLFWGGVTAVDAGNYRIETSVLNLYFDESAGFVKQTDDVRIYRADGVRPAIDPTTGGSGIEINWRVPVSVVSTGGSALTPTESAYLLALPSASTTATAVTTDPATLTVSKFIALS